MEVTINSIEEYLNETLKINRENEKDNIEQKYIFRSIGLAFRGQSDKNYELVPSIGRGCQTKDKLPIFNHEENLIEMAKYKLPHIFSNNLPPLDLLAVLQHYGIPTRLLDVTSNPLVALYFATNNTTTDGEVIVFEYDKGFRSYYPLASAIAETYKCTPYISLKEFAISVINQPSFFFDYPNDSENLELLELDIKDSCENLLLFVNPTETLERQKKQQGFFIIFPNQIIDCKKNFLFSNSILPIDKNSNKVKKRIIIKKEAKETIQNQLRFLGISEYTLFSDNVDIVCKGIVKECESILK